MLEAVLTGLAEEYMLSRKFVAKFFVLALVVLSAGMLKAQDAASLTGLVTDTSGAVVPGAQIDLVNTTTNTAYKAVSNAEGSYTIANIKPGPGYTVTFSRDGFEKVVISNMYINVATTRTQNAKLPIGATSQTVEVSASSQNVTLDTTDATVGNNFEVQFVQELPIQIRNSPAALFTMQPGVTLDGAVTGAREDQNNVTLDGLEVNDNATGQFAAIVGSAPVDSVQEFRAVTAGELSNAGQGGGGQFDLVTRSGTNKFHGNVNEYHRDTSFEANSWFNNNSDVPRAPLIRNQFGGNVGGPVLKDRLFFFFNYNQQKDTRSNLVIRTVPTDAFRNKTIQYRNASGGISVLSTDDIAAHDPQGKGFSQALADLISSRYPVANDTSGDVGDLLTTAGFRFNAPFPLNEKDYVGRIDYNLTHSHKIFGRGTVTRVDRTQSAVQYPGDPETHPFLDKSYAWVVGDTWTIGNNKVNSISGGINYEDYAFPDTFNPQKTSQFTFGGNGTGGNILSGAYSSAVNAQARTFPIPVIRDDFSWTKGKHNWAFGGTFKWENPSGNTILDYDQPLIGLGGHMNSLSQSAPSYAAFPLRPGDLSTSSTNRTRYDEALALALGHLGQVASTFNYDAKGNLLDQGTGSQENYRMYETELYFGDTWKVTPSLTISYGLRWQNYSVPYEKNGLESLPTQDFNQLFGARLAQSQAGLTGPQAVPFVQYVLGGKANHADGYFKPVYKNFAPRFAFAWNPTFDRKTVFSGGAGIIYDHTIVNAVQYQASQYSYLFQSSATQPYGVTGDPVSSLQNDPRFGGITNPPPSAPAPAAIAAPYTPFVDGTGPDAVPVGLSNGQAFNEGVDKNLKTPYSIAFNFGFQHEFPAGFILKTTYVGRLGRRLLGQADANQLIDFTDPKSGQTMGQAFAALSKEIRPSGGNITPTPQPWFENVLAPGSGEAYGFASNTDLVANGLAPLPYRGDFADTIQALSTVPSPFSDTDAILPYNVGMGSQFSEFSYYTNKGFSSYNGLLVTLHKNAGHGIQFDLNYTWSHSIDNVSIEANTPALGGYGFICDVQRPRLCRGNSDFDVSNYLSGNFIWELPFGRNRAIGATMPFWANEVVGGWSVSGLPSWHTGEAFNVQSNAFVAGYANDAPAILTGNRALLDTHVHKDTNGTPVLFKDADAAASAFVGPIGFQIGQRNDFRGPGFFNIDLGLGKTFPIWESVSLKFRADAFNSTNHPNFDIPGTSNNDITQANGAFGAITTYATGGTPRVLQLALRLEF